MIGVAVALTLSTGCALQSPPSNHDSNGAIQSTLHLESFVVNLEDPDGRAYLRIGIDLGLSHPLTDSQHSGPGSSVPRLRDTIVGMLGSCKSEALLTSGGKEKLKADLLKALRDRAPELGIEEVYFTEFLIQH